MRVSLPIVPIVAVREPVSNDRITRSGQSSIHRCSNRGRDAHRCGQCLLGPIDVRFAIADSRETEGSGEHPVRSRQVRAIRYRPTVGAARCEDDLHAPRSTARTTASRCGHGNYTCIHSRLWQANRSATTRAANRNADEPTTHAQLGWPVAVQFLPRTLGDSGKKLRAAKRLLADHRERSTRRVQLL